MRALALPALLVALAGCCTTARATPPADTYCAVCGAKQDVLIVKNDSTDQVCPACGDRYGPNAKYCPTCGARLRAVPPKNH